MNLTVASSPHIRGTIHTGRLMGDVALALLPALAVGTCVLGIRAFTVTAVSVFSALTAEWLCSRLTGKGNSLPDGSALVTGMLFALTLPASVPYFPVILGSVFAIAAAKCLCGGLGQNIFNPALLARALVMLLFPSALARCVVDGVSVATPLHHMAMGSLPKNGTWELFQGTVPGAIGEISALALIIGGGYLVVRRVTSLRIPLSYLGTVALLTLVFPKTDNALEWMLCSLLSGGVMLGAIFMATDYATSPVTPTGQIFYGMGCGALTVFFRYFGLFPEGVTYAILGMNLLTWGIECATPPRRFGVKKGAKT